MKITNVKVYGIQEAKLACRYPMSVDIDSIEDDQGKRLKALGGAPVGSGHDSALKGISVHYDITMHHVMLPQFMRYHFHDIVSSQSKMHRISKMKLKEQCDGYVDSVVIDRCQFLMDKYTADPTDENFHVLVTSLPMGLELTMRITSNYLQIKSIFLQRYNHRGIWWKEYATWALSLPEFAELTGVIEIIENRQKHKQMEKNQKEALAYADDISFLVEDDEYSHDDLMNLISELKRCLAQ